MNQAAERILSLPPYLFAELDRLKNEVKASGMDVIDLGVGDPDLATPDFVIEAMREAVGDIDTHHYPSYNGLKAFREAIADWYARRFHVCLDPDNEILALIGSKEGIAHLPLAWMNPGDLALVPDPGYPVYSIATGFAGGRVANLPLEAENDFLVPVEEVDRELWDSAKLLFLNYPNNPTSGTASMEYFERVVHTAKKHGVSVCHDAAYSELYFDGSPSPSFLQNKGSKEVGIEMHSLSKSFNMTGWRIGFAVGNREMIAALGKTKTNMDSSLFSAVQRAGIVALREGDTFLGDQRQLFQKRRDILAKHLQDAGLSFKLPKATFYVWVEVPEGYRSAGFSQKVLKETGVVITPGVGLGPSGDGHVRFAITAPEERLDEAGQRIKKLLS